MKRVLLAALLLVCSQVFAQAYPSRPIRVVCTIPPGGAPDVMARTIGNAISQTLGQPVVIENRAGANGIIAAEAVLKAPADGYTLFVADTGNYAVTAALYPNFPYDVRKDFVPVVLAAVPAVYLVANAASPFRSVEDFVRIAKAGAGVTYGSTGNGNVTHLAMEMFRMLTAANLTHVPYKGAAGLAPALLSGDVPIGFIGYPIVAPHARAGKLRILAVSTPQRAAVTPDIPTMAESGVPGYGFNISVGYLARAGTPREIVLRLNEEINRALRTPSVRQSLEAVGIPPSGGTQEAFGDAIRNEVEQMAALVKASGARVE